MLWHPEFSVLSFPHCHSCTATNPPDSRTNVVLFFAGDGVAADLSVLDGRQIPRGDQISVYPAGTAQGAWGQGTARFFFPCSKDYKEEEVPGKVFCCHLVVDARNNNKPNSKAGGWGTWKAES